MRIPRIHTGQTLEANGSVELEAGPRHYITRVLRMRVGDSLILFNGGGGQYRATIEAMGKKSVLLATGQFEALERESDLQLQLGIAMSRGERMDWIIQKATELGISAVSPLLSERTEVKLKGDRQDKKLKHWQQIATSACEQCGRNRVPPVHPPQALEQWLAGVQADVKLVLHHRAGTSTQPATSPRSIALLVGPEGGLSSSEITAAESAGFTSLQLGPRVLRTETAPLAAIAILQSRWGDMNEVSAS